MKPAKITKIFSEPVHWSEIPWGENYRVALENQLRLWFTKMYGFHLLKIGNLSAEINTEACAISHQVNVSLSGHSVQVTADPLHLPFVEKSIDACLLAQTLSWCHDPHCLLREVNRVLIDDGWLILSSFNPLSLMGLRKLMSLSHRRSLYNSRMFTLTRQIDWLSLLNFEILYYNGFQVLPWSRQGGKLLSKHLPALGCMQVIVARKRTIPLMFNPIKQSKIKMQLRPSVSATQQCKQCNTENLISLLADNLRLHILDSWLQHMPIRCSVHSLDGQYDLLPTSIQSCAETVLHLAISIDRCFSLAFSLPFSSRAFSSYRSTL